MKWRSLSLLALLLCLVSGAHAAEEVAGAFPAAGDESARFETEVIVDGLSEPCGLVFAPRTSSEDPREIFFVESGAGRVLGFHANKPSARREVVTGLAEHEAGPLETAVSAWSLGFVTPTKLAILGGLKEATNRVGVFVLPDEDHALTTDDIDHQVEIAMDDATRESPMFPSMIFGDTTAYFTSGIATGPGQVFRAALVANRIDSPSPLLNVADGRALPWPSGLCLSPATKMQYLVASFAGQLSTSRDSRIAFLIPANGKVALGLTPGLFDIVGLSYSPSGQLYAIDLAWSEPTAGGIYRIDDVRYEGQPACRAVKIAEAARPTSMLFDGSGILYVTTWGDGGSKQGTIVKITGEF